MAKYKYDKLIVHGMTHEDIQDVVRAFAQAAKDAKAIGCDAVELHGAHGYLIDQFFWEGTNRSEEHTSELQSRPHLVCRLLLEKKKDIETRGYYDHTQVTFY